ncbi:MAG: glycosyltransferase family A protein [bacterium]
MSNPKISIIIPTYQHAKELAKCLDSILTQTFQDFEVIVVNDGSTDETSEVLEKYKRRFSARGGSASGGKNKDLGFKIINQENQGANPARNRGAQEAKGEYFLFCDADIAMEPSMLEKMANALQTNLDKSYVYCSFKFGWKTFKLWPFDAEKLKKMNYIHTTSLLRRVDFPGFDEKIRRLQDWDLWLMLLEKGKTGLWLSEILFQVTPRQKGMSQWLPSFFYKFLPFSPQVKKYKEAERIIKEKHHLN